MSRFAVFSFLFCLAALPALGEELPLHAEEDPTDGEVADVFFEIGIPVRSPYRGYYYYPGDCDDCRPSDPFYYMDDPYYRHGPPPYYYYRGRDYDDDDDDHYRRRYRRRRHYRDGDDDDDD